MCVKSPSVCVLSSNMMSALGALIVPIWWTFTLHCLDLQLSNTLSHALFIALDPDTNISWKYVLYVKREDNSIREKYSVIHVKQTYIIIVQGFCWMISILLRPEETDFVDCVLMDFLSCNHFDDDNFMKYIEEISQSYDIVVRLQNSTKKYWIRLTWEWQWYYWISWWYRSWLMLLQWIFI